MDTPAAALMRRTDTPSWPNSLRQRRVASTNASRRTAGAARWNLGTCRLVAIIFPFPGVYRSAAEWAAGLHRPAYAGQPLRRTAARGLRLRRRVDDEGRDSIGHIAPDIEIPVLHRRIVALGVNARPNPILHARAYRP